MFEEMSLLTWLSAIIIFALGGVAGYLAARQTQSQHTRRLEDELSRIKLDNSTYRAQVERHFLKTSTLFSKLTENYREVYEHLAYGAQTLCKEKPNLSALNLPRSSILPEVETRSQWTPSAPAEKTPPTRSLPEVYDIEERTPYDVVVEEDEHEDVLRRGSPVPVDLEEAAGAEPTPEAKTVEAKSAAADESAVDTEAASDAEAAEEVEVEEIHLGVESASGIDFNPPPERRRSNKPPYR